MANETIALHLICENPPPGVFGLQDKDGEVMAGERLSNARSGYSFELRVKQAENGQPNFTGDYAHGTAKERFLYLTLKRADGNIIRRIKVHLKTITWAQVEAVLRNPDAWLEASVDGRGAASVPLLGDGWVVRNKAANG